MPDLILQARIGSSLVLAQAGSGQVHLLNQSAAELFGLMIEHEGDEEPLVALLVQRCGSCEDQAQQDVAALTALWRQSGLIDAAPAVTPRSDAWIIPCPSPRPLPPGAIAATLGGYTAAISVESPELCATITAAIDLLLDPDAATCRHVLEVAGGPSDWTLRLNSEDFEHGQSNDAALVAILHLLMDLAARAEDRLLVVHGAGLVGADGRAFLLIAPGGSGKTTLSAALNATGFDLLSDDVVPVHSDGSLIRLTTPICVKSGSWPVLAGLRPEIETLPIIQRYGEPVKYLRPIEHGPERQPVLERLIFPRYQRDSAPSCTRLPPEEVLQRVIEAECLVKDLTQEKLDALVCWISSVPAYSLIYPDLPSALDLVRSLVEP